MDQSKQGSFEFSMEWQSEGMAHNDRYFVEKINFWRDFFPGTMADGLNALEVGETFSEGFAKGTLVEPFDKNKVYKVPRSKLNLKALTEEGTFLRRGRYYPRGMFSSFGFSPRDVRPVRIVDDDERHIIMDANHPLSQYPIKVAGTYIRPLAGRTERGGNCHDVSYLLTDGGPGLQAMTAAVETDFYLDHAFDRDDTQDDAVFYQAPRLVDHIDRVASAHVSELYRRFVSAGMTVLDVMASWNSHLDVTPGSISLTGLGLNPQELAKNPLLSASILQDLNQTTELPGDDSVYDAAICTVSIEYLVKPMEVVNEIARVLKPGAPLVITFSDRWFPPKAIKIWKELHPFERMGLVADYLKRSGRFTDLHTESIRGYPRPAEANSPLQRVESDPIFAVWGHAL